jgi:hypothetical protein
MASDGRPTKEQVREWLAGEVAAARPPPSPDRVREMLGWKLTEAERKMKSRLKVALF